MGDEHGKDLDVKTDGTSQGTVNDGDLSQTALISTKTGAERPTSIIPSKAKLEPVRPTVGEISEGGIHVVHLVIFFGLLAFLYAGVWKFGKKIKF